MSTGEESAIPPFHPQPGKSSSVVLQLGRSTAATWAGKIADRDKVFYIHTKTKHGSPAWYLVEIRPSRENEFLQRMAVEGELNLEDFGTILESGYGESPSPQAIQRIRTTFPDRADQFLELIQRSKPPA